MRSRYGVLLAALLLFPSLALPQDAYYKAIQKGREPQVKPSDFKRIEQDALKDFARPETYEKLASLWANTTEKVWALVYAEAFCHLSTDDDAVRSMGSRMFEWYERSLTKSGNSLSVTLTEHAQVSQGKAPFESQFEFAFLFAAIPVSNQLEPMTIEKLSGIRQRHLSMWTQKKLPETELVKRQAAILSAGHYDAYNYWLFRNARPDEFNQWLKTHQAEFDAWLGWLSKNKFAVKSPDFHRPKLV